MSSLSVNAALQKVLAQCQTRNTETVSIYQALGRVLAEDVYANRNVPPYDVSAMDGFAVISSDLIAANVSLEIVEDIKAGDRPKNTLSSGQCARIMTGAPIPLGADAVIRVEDTTLLDVNKVQINVAVARGNDIRELGESMKVGQAILSAGTEITSGVLAVLATVKYKTIQVFQRPRVAILSTGDELEAIDEPVDPYKIPDANSYALMAQVQALGIEPTLLGIARDDPQQLSAALKQGLDYDILLVSGGTSVGVHDYVRPTLAALGVEMLFWRVDMKPGHPLAFGKTESCLLFGLPGNPVSSMVCFEQFALPALRKVMGHCTLCRRTIKATLAHTIKHKSGRTEFVRVSLKQEQGAYIATSTGPQGSGMLLSMAQADGLLMIPAELDNIFAGSEVIVQLLDSATFQGEQGF